MKATITIEGTCRSQPTIEDIPSKYRVHDAGEYNPGIFRCVDWQCPGRMGNDAGTVLGFAERIGVLAVVHECPVCFTRQFWHCKHTISLNVYLDELNRLSRNRKGEG
jgi:hypothetical protein